MFSTAELMFNDKRVSQRLHVRFRRTDSRRKVRDKVLTGFYDLDGENHGWPVYRRHRDRPGNAPDCEEVVLYHWNDEGNGRLGSEVGWWFGTGVGSSEVWAFHDDASLEPPRRGWITLDFFEAPLGTFELIVQPCDGEPAPAPRRQSPPQPPRRRSPTPRGSVGAWVKRQAHRNERSRSPQRRACPTPVSPGPLRLDGDEAERRASHTRRFRSDGGIPPDTPLRPDRVRVSPREPWRNWGDRCTVCDGCPFVRCHTCRKHVCRDHSYRCARCHGP